jgi:hypothetical protein
MSLTLRIGWRRMDDSDLKGAAGSLAEARKLLESGEDDI